MTEQQPTAPRQGQTRTGDTDEFERLCQEVAAAAADYHVALSGRGVTPGFTPGEVRALFAEMLSGEGAAAGSLLADWRERAVPTLTAVVGLRELSSKNLGLAGRLHHLVSEHPDFEVLHEPTPYLYCFRYVPHGLAERQEDSAVRALLDRLNGEIVEAVRRRGPALLTTVHVRGRVALRMSACPLGTPEGDVETMFEAVARWGRLLTKSYSARYENRIETEAPRCPSEYCSSPTEVSAT